MMELINSPISVDQGQGNARVCFVLQQDFDAVSTAKHASQHEWSHAQSSIPLLFW